MQHWCACSTTFEFLTGGQIDWGLSWVVSTWGWIKNRKQPRFTQILRLFSVFNTINLHHSFRETVISPNGRCMLPDSSNRVPMELERFSSVKLRQAECSISATSVYSTVYAECRVRCSVLPVTQKMYMCPVLILQPTFSRREKKILKHLLRYFCWKRLP